MAVTKDASSPTPSTNTTVAALTTASFTPPAGSLIVACAVVGNSAGSGTQTGAMTDSLSGSWTTDNSETTSGSGACYVFRRTTATSGAAMTCTMTPTGTNAKGNQLAVVVLDGATGSVGNKGQSTTALHASITPSAIGSLIVCAGVLVTSSVALTQETGFTALLSTQDGTNGETYGSNILTTATSSLSAITYGWTNTNTGSQSCAAEYPPSAVAAAKVSPVLVLQGRNRGATY